MNNNYKKRPTADKRAKDNYTNESANSENTVSGRNSVRELLSSGRDIDKIYIKKGEQEGSVKLLIALARERKIPIIEVDKQKLDMISATPGHQGIVAIASERNYSSVDDILAIAEQRGEKPFVIICDGIEDPHNLGAIIRSAECAGAHGIIIPKRRSSGLTATVSKASAGALEHMAVAKVTNIAQTLDELKEKGLWLFLADMGGVNYYDTDMSCAVGLVLGSEGFGASRLVKEKCDITVSIPLYGSINSMNVSCAAAVLMSEIAMQRSRGKR